MGESNRTSYLFFLSLFGCLAAIFNVDDSVVDLETLAALYENVSIKDIQRQSFQTFISSLIKKTLRSKKWLYVTPSAPPKIAKPFMFFGSKDFDIAWERLRHSF